MDDYRFDIIIKIVIMGEASVGKTNLLLRYSQDRFDDNQKPTIGMDFISKDVVVENRRVKVQFWDTAGQEKYRSLASSYYKIANGAILVYDVTNRDTFLRINHWLDEIKNNTTKDLKVMLIGNKNDLMAQRQVSLEEGRSYAEERNLFFWETSAKDNHDQAVNKAFNDIISECMKEMVSTEGERQRLESARVRPGIFEIHVPEEPKSKPNSSCCK